MPKAVENGTRKERMISVKYYHILLNLKSAIVNYYRTKRFKLDIKNICSEKS
jgi:hypothetical protein